MGYANLEPESGVVLRIDHENKFHNKKMLLHTEAGNVNFIIGQRTEIVDHKMFLPGQRVTAFYDRSLPAPLVYPPQYTAQMIAVPDRNEQITLQYFDSDLLAGDHSLQLNIGENTIVETLNGQNVKCDLENHTLLVFYTVTTRSIPPQTTPEKVVVLG